MNSIIADSSGLISLFSPKDTNNKLAIKISKKIVNSKQSVCIPSDVFSETLNVVGRKISHKAAIALGNKLLIDERFVVIDIAEAIRRAALKKFKDQGESVSFTDCIVMATADHFKTKEIFGFDKTFSKNGYMFGAA